jgi:hypothetical protein
MRRIILLVAASLGGLLAAVLVAFIWRKMSPEILPWGVAAIVIIGGLGLWGKSLFVPAHMIMRSLPIHKYLLPCAFSILGLLMGGIVGFSVGLLISTSLLAISEFRMRNFQYHQTRGGSGEPGSVTFYCFTARFLAGTAMGVLLWKQYGVELMANGSSNIAKMVMTPDFSTMFMLTGLGAVFGFLYELAEHLAGAIYRFK